MCACLLPVDVLCPVLSTQGMIEVIKPFLSNADQAVLLRDCILQLTSSPSIDRYLVVSVEVSCNCVLGVPQ